MSIVVQHTPPASTFFFPAAAYGWRQAQERDLDRRLKYGEFVAEQRASAARLAETARQFDISQGSQERRAAEGLAERAREFGVTYERLTAEAARGRTFETAMQEDRQAAALNLQQQEAAIAKQVKETGEERANVNAEMGWKAIQGVQFDEGGEAIRRKTQADLDAIGTWEKGTDPEKRRERTARIEAAQKLLKDRDIKQPNPQKYVDDHTAYVTLPDGRKVGGTINSKGDFRPIQPQKETPQKPNPMIAERLRFIREQVGTMAKMVKNAEDEMVPAWKAAGHDSLEAAVKVIKEAAEVAYPTPKPIGLSDIVGAVREALAGKAGAPPAAGEGGFFSEAVKRATQLPTVPPPEAKAETTPPLEAQVPAVAQQSGISPGLLADYIAAYRKGSAVARRRLRELGFLGIEEPAVPPKELRPAITTGLNMPGQGGF